MNSDVPSYACHNSVNYVCNWHWFVRNLPCLDTQCNYFSDFDYLRHRNQYRLTIKTGSYSRSINWTKFVMEPYMIHINLSLFLYTLSAQTSFTKISTDIQVFRTITKKSYNFKGLFFKNVYFICLKFYATAMFILNTNSKIKKQLILELSTNFFQD